MITWSLSRYHSTTKILSRQRRQRWLIIHTKHEKRRLVRWPATFNINVVCFINSSSFFSYLNRWSQLRVKGKKKFLPSYFFFAKKLCKPVVWIGKWKSRFRVVTRALENTKPILSLIVPSYSYSCGLRALIEAKRSTEIITLRNHLNIRFFHN